MTLVQLEYIVAVDTYRSFGTAAEKCFVTQPTLSVQIQKLEDSLGVKIFDRSKQPVIPTDIGEQVILQARTVLAESLRLEELIAIHKKELAGELKVGVIPTVAPYLLPKIILNFSAKYPKVRVQIWEYTTDEIIQRLKTGLLDCGILSTPLEDKSLSELPLFYEDFVAYISPSCELLRKDKIEAKDIRPEELWLLNEGHCMRNQVLNICVKRDGGRSRAFEYNTGSVETLKRMVDINTGITILPELSLSDFSEEQLYRVRRFKNPVPVREISIVTHRSFIKRGIIKALQDEILSSVPAEMKKKTKKAVMEASL